MIFSVFIAFLVFLGLSHFLRWSPDYFQIEILWFLWAKWTILRLFNKGCAMQKYVLFEISHFFYHFIGLSQFLRWNSNHFQIEFLWFLWGEWTILRLFYERVYCAKMCNFWDIALFYHFIVLGKFCRWNSDHYQIEFLCCLWDQLTILRLF